MINLLISLGIATAITCVLKFACGFALWASILPAIFAFFICNMILARRIVGKVQAIAQEAQKELQAQHFDKGIKVLESAFQYEKWQFFIGSELHANVGVLYYSMKKPAEARPHLMQAGPRGPSSSRARTMLACLDFQDKKESSMKENFERAVLANKKDVLAWAAYGWCLESLGKHSDAIAVMVRGSEANPTEEKLKNTLNALKNGKKMKMRTYGLEWYQLFLERPPMDLAMGAPGSMGRRVSFQRR